MNYSEIVDNIQAWTENDATEFTTKIPTIINLAELRIYKDVDLTIARKEATLATPIIGQSLLPAPSDLIVPRWVRISNGGYIMQKDESFIREYLATAATSGTPKYYATAASGANLLFAPSFSSESISVQIGYTYRPTPLSASNTTTWLSLNAWDVLLFACMVESAGFMKMEQQDLANWEARYTASADALRIEEQRRRRTDEYRTGEIR